MSTNTELMDGLFDQIANPPANGDEISGKVIGLSHAALYVDLAPFGTGIIYGREYIIARDLIRKLHHGDDITARVVDVKNEEGYIELSLKEAKQALVWAEVDAAIKGKTPIEIPVQDANKGGLIMNWQGLQGFLPASQLSSKNYPRVQDGDKDKILSQLKQLVDQKLMVTIIGASQIDGKLVFSEKGGDTTIEKQKKVAECTVGDTFEGEVTGMVDFGVFVKIGDGLEGLVHISEMDWALVEDPKKVYSVGDKVKVKIIEVKDGKVSLSIKALAPNPWQEAAKRFKKGDLVDAVVIKYNKHGALAAIEEGVAGLIHISEFEDEDNLRERLELGKRYQTKITLFDPIEQKMTLTTKLSDEKKS